MLKGKEILLYLAVKYKGNWEEIYDAVKRKEEFEENDVLEVENSIGCDYITLVDNQYPDTFKNAYKPPFTMFYHGNIELINNNNIISFIGSKKVSKYTKESCTKIINDLKDVIIATELESENDILIQENAIKNGLKTIVVLTDGINCQFDSEPRKKAIIDHVSKNGLVISEIPHDIETTENEKNFLCRTVIAISEKIVATEIHQKTKSLIEIGHACNGNKDIYVIPQMYGNNTYNNHLIIEGAELLNDVETLLD